MNAHAAVAAHFMVEEELVMFLRFDPDLRKTNYKLYELRHFVSLVTRGDVRKENTDWMTQVGWSEEAIFTAVTVVGLFCFYNAWVGGTGVRPLTPAEYEASGKRLAERGYEFDAGTSGAGKAASATER